MLNNKLEVQLISQVQSLVNLNIQGRMDQA